MTTHDIILGNSQQMGRVASCSIDLIVTSPPYPMVQMWDGLWGVSDIECDPMRVHESMHRELDKVWAECFRTLKDGGFLCVNIGDATRSINGEFRLFNNHSRIVSSCLKIGFENLPNIIWRKQTNAPNKFMGSGMLPCGAYVTLEHEWILVFRKRGKRAYKLDRDKALRRSSAFFWEERNKWFSDLWEIKGVKQMIVNSQTRERNASFPLEIPFRLVNMYSQMRDVVLDPFMGMGTTLVASMLTGRNSIGFEIDKGLRPAIKEFVDGMDVNSMKRLVVDRFNAHLAFIEERISLGKTVKYTNQKLNCKVMTSQETDIDLLVPTQIDHPINVDNLSYRCFYKSLVNEMLERKSERRSQ